MNLSFEQCFDISKDFDAEFSGRDFEFEGTDFWPLIRVQILYYLNLLSLQNGEKLFPEVDSTIEKKWKHSASLQEKIENHFKYSYYKWKSKRYIKPHRQLVCFFDMESHQVVISYSDEKKN